jgi:hypothetical protein
MLPDHSLTIPPRRRPLLLLSQVFDNPARMTEVKAQRLKESMKGEFGSVFELCQYVCAPFISIAMSSL